MSGTGEKGSATTKTPADFLKSIRGRPVVVKLNSGVDYRGRVKPRPIIRIGLFIISHSTLVSIVCCVTGVLALLLLPVLAKSTYFSENALMPGSAKSMLSGKNVVEANRFVKELSSLGLKPPSTGIEIPKLIARRMADLGGEVSYHNFHPQSKYFHPLHFFSSPDPEMVRANYSCSSYGVNIVGIARAPRSDGKEAIVLVTPYNSTNISLGEAMSLGIAYSAFSLFTQVSWLAKDIIWVAADSRHGEYDSIVSWLRDYHSPSFGGLEKLNAKVCRESLVTGSEVSDSFLRGGTMAAALVIKVADESELFDKDALSIYAEASNGQMPNLDLINVVNYLAVHGQSFYVKVDKLPSLLRSKWLKVLGKVIESLGKIARNLNPQWKFGIPVSEYVEGTATLASSLYNQALGVPTGLHGAFRDYQVDAVTLDILPKRSSYHKARRSEFLLHGARLVEGITRSVNNLLEKFHQSFFLYLLTSPSKFVSVGVYMIAFLLLIAPLPVVAASLYSDAHKCCPELKNKEVTSMDFVVERTLNSKSWRWLYAAKTVFVIHLWGFVVTVLPFFMSQIPGCSSTTSLLIWIASSGFSLILMHVLLGSPFLTNSVPQSEGKEWLLLKSVTITAAFIGLCLMSVINFATAEIGALLTVPICLMARPLKRDLKVRSTKAFARAALNLFLLHIGFPVAAYFLVKGAFEGFDNISIGDFWYWVESLWVWNSATYIYICMAYTPCWVLCIHILLHPC
ncbi:uncharacterized protein LOC108199635 isoform X1 [Daucus carota subsp. sativus]|uniref:uncharacterized protein LOC108199635 isoform X1 n=2 Tax=Daucus carota subsp. sativus TaxID=79200 RepID=UPI0007EF4750|nr:PREDICTED: glycosylphosphatidylinositol anchor attachment 1 protein-like isoform X1 [Daucus carota subsp. sativus]